MGVYKFGSLMIPQHEIELKFVRSSGKGGQHVNKVSSKAQLSWDVQQNVSIAEEIKTRLMFRYLHRFDSHGVLHLASDVFREQHRNAQACLSRLKEMLLSVQHPPKPRIATRPTTSSRTKRLDRKKQRGKKKALRKKVDWE